MGGGVFGYFRKGSTASLFGGAGIGLLLTLAGYLSLKAFEKKKNSYPALIVETGSLYCLVLELILLGLDPRCDSDALTRVIGS